MKNSVALRVSNDVPFVRRPGDFRTFLRACAFRRGSAKDDLAQDLLNDVVASK
jgi:hypothetical protein